MGSLDLKKRSVKEDCKTWGIFGVGNSKTGEGKERE
jgi:hypothetical protein